MSEQYSSCPKCHGEIIWGDLEVDWEIWQTAECKSCGFEWQAVYTFSHNETRDCESLDDEGNVVDHD